MLEVLPEHLEAIRLHGERDYPFDLHSAHRPDNISRISGRPSVNAEVGVLRDAEETEDLVLQRG
jgi:hypothetical protein